jgi:hypothetical protein
MASQEKRIFVANLKASLESFFAAKRIAKSALAPLGPASEPCAGVDDDQLRRLEAKLQRVRAMLRYAERLAADCPANESTELWLRELRGVECAVEDILEKVQFEALRASLVEDLGTDGGEEPVKNRSSPRGRRPAISLAAQLSRPQGQEDMGDVPRNRLRPRGAPSGPGRWGDPGAHLRAPADLVPQLRQALRPGGRPPPPF